MNDAIKQVENEKSITKKKSINEDIQIEERNKKRKKPEKDKELKEKKFLDCLNLKSPFWNWFKVKKKKLEILICINNKKYYNNYQ